MHSCSIVRRAGFRCSRRRRGEIGDALAQHADEVAHDVDDGALHAEEIRVEIALGDAVANLAGETGVELVLGDGVDA
jgi:hypothetical protein